MNINTCEWMSVQWVQAMQIYNSKSPLPPQNPTFLDKNVTVSSGDRSESRNRNHVHRRDLESKQMEGDLETLVLSELTCSSTPRSLLPPHSVITL